MQIQLTTHMLKECKLNLYLSTVVKNVKKSPVNEGEVIIQYQWYSRDYLKHSGMVKQFSYS